MPSESSESESERLPEGVDEARIKGGTAVCRDCEFTVRFDGDESYDEAREKWHSDEHREQHFDDGLRADGGQPSTGKHRCRNCGERFDRPTEGGVPACPEGAVHVAEEDDGLRADGGQPLTGSGRCTCPECGNSSDKSEWVFDWEGEDGPILVCPSCGESIPENQISSEDDEPEIATDGGPEQTGTERMWTVKWLGETHRMTESQLDAILQAKIVNARGDRDE